MPAVKTVIYTRKIGKVLRKNEEEDAKYRSLQHNPELLDFHAHAASGNGLPRERVEISGTAAAFHFQKVDDELSEHEWLVSENSFLAGRSSWVRLHFTLIGVDFPFERFPHVAAWPRGSASGQASRRAC